MKTFATIILLFALVQSVSATTLGPGLEVHGAFVFTDICNEKHPESLVQNVGAFKEWLVRNSVAVAEQTSDPDFESGVAKLRAYLLHSADLQALEKSCKDLPLKLMEDGFQPQFIIAALAT